MIFGDARGQQDVVFDGIAKRCDEGETFVTITTKIDPFYSDTSNYELNSSVQVRECNDQFPVHIFYEIARNFQDFALGISLWSRLASFITSFSLSTSILNSTFLVCFRAPGPEIMSFG